MKNLDVITGCLALAFLFFIMYFFSNTPIFPGPPSAFASAIAQKKETDYCKIYNNKAIELAEESAKDLPPDTTMDFDPRMAKSNSSIAYSQIYQNCKQYAE